MASATLCITHKENKLAKSECLFTVFLFFNIFLGFGLGLTLGLEFGLRLGLGL